MAVTEQQVIDVVAKLWAGAKPVKIEVTKIIPFVDGRLFFVSIYTKPEGKEPEEHFNYCYVVGNDIKQFDDFEHLADALGPRRNMINLAYTVLDTGGIAGIIGIVIVLTMCFFVLREGSAVDAKVLTALTLALGSVMGFYFGKREAAPPLIRRGRN